MHTLHTIRRRYKLMSNLDRLSYIEGAMADPNGLGGLRLRLHNASIPEKYYGIFYTMFAQGLRARNGGGGELDSSATPANKSLESKVFSSHPQTPAPESKPICIDGGAHSGLVSDIILYCGGVVHSFEPNTLLHTILESKYHANPDVILHNAALSHEAGEVSFYVYDDISQGNRIQGASDPSLTQSAAKQYKVPAIDLCAYIQDLLKQHERLYFVKIDIEGAEFDIMDKLLDLKLYEKIDYIACETHERFFQDGSARIHRLREKIAKLRATNILLDWI